MNIKVGQLIQTNRDLTYDPPFYLYPVDNGLLVISAGTRLVVLSRPKKTTRRMTQGYKVWVRFKDNRLLVPEDAFESVLETSDDTQQRICERLITKAQEHLDKVNRDLKEAEQNLKDETALSQALAQLRPGDYARFDLFGYSLVARIDKFTLGKILVTVLASEAEARDKIQLQASEIERVIPYPVSDLPLLIGWHYKFKALDKALKGGCHDKQS